MNEGTIVIIVLSSLFGLLILGVFLLEIYEKRNKFQIGDVVEIVYENEFERHVYYNKIIDIGKKYYLVVEVNEDGMIFNQRSSKLKSNLNRYKKSIHSVNFYKFNKKTLKYEKEFL